MKSTSLLLQDAVETMYHSLFVECVWGGVDGLGAYDRPSTSTAELLRTYMCRMPWKGINRRWIQPYFSQKAERHEERTDVLARQNISDCTADVGGPGLSYREPPKTVKVITQV